MIRWIIRDRLGTGPADDTHLEGAHRIDVRHLVDAPGNAPGPVSTLIDEGHAALCEGKVVLVVCDFGVSRSNAIAAGVLSRFRSIPLSEAISDVITATGESDIKISMIETVKKVLVTGSTVPRTGAIAVTGASGAIGRAVSAQLADTALLLKGRADFDLLQSPALLADRLESSGIESIIHLAHPKVFSSNSAMGEALVLQKNVMDAAAAVGARFILVSCSSVFGTGMAGVAVAPGSKRRPTGIVGTIKSLQEDLLVGSVDMGALDGMIIRVAPVYGVGSTRPRFIQSFRQAIMAGNVVVTHRLSDGPAAIELLHLKDAARGIVAAVTRGAADVYHVGGADVIEPAQIAGQIAQMLGKPLHHTETTISGLGAHPRLDWTAIQTELGWHPEVAFEVGLAEVISAEN